MCMSYQQPLRGEGATKELLSLYLYLYLSISHLRLSLLPLLLLAEQTVRFGVRVIGSLRQPLTLTPVGLIDGFVCLPAGLRFHIGQLRTSTTHVELYTTE